MAKPYSTAMDHARSPGRGEFFLLLLLLVSVASAVIWVRTATVRETYAFVQQEKILKALREETQNLRLKWVKTTSPKRLEALAPGLGLQPPTLNQRLKISSKASPQG